MQVSLASWAVERRCQAHESQGSQRVGGSGCTPTRRWTGIWSPDERMEQQDLKGERTLACGQGQGTQEQTGGLCRQGQRQGWCSLEQKSTNLLGARPALAMDVLTLGKAHAHRKRGACSQQLYQVRQ